jgi:outer membrane protein assembly factor BamC
VNRSPSLHSRQPLLSAPALAVALALGGCSSIENLLTGEKIDYRTSAKTQSKGLEVPPDLTQLARDSRYQLPGGVVSAAATTGAASPNAAATGAQTVAPVAVGPIRVERLGNQRWLVVNMTPEQLWPQVRAFWQERGFAIDKESAEAGVMETDWAENRAKIPMDPIRSVLGRVLDSVYSSGERDRFRTRIERVPGGSEIYISHRGMEETWANAAKDSTVWRFRDSDPALEAEFLSRLMVRLGTKEEVARAAVASAPEGTARARILGSGSNAALEMDETFDRAWRRVGLALDRSGFSVEDRDRAAGIYFVRYIDPKDAEKGEPSFFSRLFGGGGPAPALRYRISVKAAGDKTVVTVLNSAGAAEASDNTKRIVAQLVNDLK